MQQAEDAQSQEKKDPARLVVEDNAAPDEATVATVKSMPLLLKDREYVVKMIWTSNEAGVTIAFESVNWTLTMASHSTPSEAARGPCTRLRIFQVEAR